mgnify:FL=1
MSGRERIAGREHESYNGVHAYMSVMHCVRVVGVMLSSSHHSCSTSTHTYSRLDYTAATPIITRIEKSSKIINNNNNNNLKA